MLDIGKVKTDDTVLVSGASGATGSIAAQIAKIKGAKVIGIAGSEEKCQWLLKAAKLDGAINYKEENILTQLKVLAPAGIDIYFDNVGGYTLDCALANLALHARVVLCGAISTYDGLSDGAIKNYLNLVLKRGTMQGFLVFDFAPRMPEAFADLSSWLAADLLHYEVDIQQGLENAPQTLARLFAGKNLGKQLLKI
jgi:NADPH-dependent curcumin reductase CurA